MRVNVKRRKTNRVKVRKRRKNVVQDLKTNLRT